VINLISRTTAATGLLVHADLDDNVYETGIEVADATMKQAAP